MSTDTTQQILAKAIADLEREGVGLSETATALHAMAYGLIRMNLGPAAASRWSALMAGHAAELARHDLGETVRH